MDVSARNIEQVTAEIDAMFLQIEADAELMRLPTQDGNGSELVGGHEFAVDDVMCPAIILYLPNKLQLRLAEGVR